MWLVHVRSSVICTLRNLKQLTLSMMVLSMEIGVNSWSHFLKSTISSLVLATLRERWFSIV